MEGAKARVAMATTPGHYEDTYVKTARGWRFKGRAYISTTEAAAGLTAADFDEIRRIGGNDTGQFQDVWLAFPEGKRSGVQAWSLPRRKRAVPQAVVFLPTVGAMTTST